MKKLLFFSLYFSEGAPIGFIWWALPAILKKSGIDVSAIATLAAVATLPWAFKFILAPLVDFLSTWNFPVKTQLMIYQIFMGVFIFFIPAAVSDLNLPLLTIVIASHGVFAALQDICIDTLAIKSIPKNQMGRINGVMQSGMLVGRSLFGGAGVYVAIEYGLPILCYLLASAIWTGLLFIRFSKINVKPSAAMSFKNYFKNFLSLMSSRRIWCLIGITYFAGFSYNGVSAIASALLIDFGASSTLQGLTYGLFLPASMSIGALIGGHFSDILGKKKVLGISLSLSIVTSILIGYFFDHFPGLNILIGNYIPFYFFIGSTTAALYGLLMKNTSLQFAALEYSILMGIVNLCESSSSFLLGRLIIKNSYFFSCSCIGLICSITFFFLHKFQSDFSD